MVTEQLEVVPRVWGGVDERPRRALTRRALRLHAANYSREAVASFYRWIWNLFYAEYALLPFL